MANQINPPTGRQSLKEKLRPFTDDKEAKEWLKQYLIGKVNEYFRNRNLHEFGNWWQLQETALAK
jgi:hypothetical protein